MSGKLNLKNHRSEMSPEKSIMLIESLLVKAGATNVSKTIVDKQIEGIVFEIPVNGMVINFKLPSKLELFEMIQTKETEIKNLTTLREVLINISQILNCMIERTELK